MEVYKICKSRYAKKLSASGVANRWNKADEMVIYAASSGALAALENVAHRVGINLTEPYQLVTIQILEPTLIKEITIKELPAHWRKLEAYIELQEIGSAWYNSLESPVLKVPSALVPQEYNYIFNTKHPLFSTQVILKSSEDWVWDKRLL